MSRHFKQVKVLLSMEGNKQLEAKDQSHQAT